MKQSSGLGELIAAFFESFTAARSRFSVVFILCEGVWKVLSAHNSIAVADEDAFATD